MSAVVPTRNEAARLPGLLARLGPEVDEIVVVDGESTDDTRDRAVAAGAIVVAAPVGRGVQLNVGARMARGDRLWFVHADAEVAVGSGAALRAAAAEWGCFAGRMQSRDPRLRWTAFWMNLRARVTGSCTGDMGIWMQREMFEALGGYPPAARFEDLVLSDAARRRAPWQVLGPPIGISARRWEQEGMGRTIVAMLVARAAWRLGLLQPTALETGPT